jgi:hypothetical protein
MPHGAGEINLARIQNQSDCLRNKQALQRTRRISTNCWFGLPMGRCLVDANLGSAAHARYPQKRVLKNAHRVRFSAAVVRYLTNDRFKIKHFSVGFSRDPWRDDQSEE